MYFSITTTLAFLSVFSPLHFSLGLHSVGQEITPPCEPFCEVHCLKLTKCFHDFAAIMVISFILILFNALLRSGKRISHTVLCLVGKDVWSNGHFVLSQKVVHRQAE
jgi:hypothetical protein